jgi:hypothetical protein
MFDLQYFALYNFHSMMYLCSICSIEELVKVNKNGLLFSTSSELADELMVSLTSAIYFPCNSLNGYLDSSCLT